MKLQSLLLTIAVCGMTLMSCGNSNKSSNDSIQMQEADEIVVDTLSDTCPEDTICNDSIVTRGGTASEGFGRCSKCSCKAFEGRGDVCKNCGHSYKKHY